MDPEVRVDPLTGHRSIVAGDRATRPGGSFRVTAPEPVVPEDDPFLEGHEDQTPPEVYAVRPDGGAADTPGWTVRAVPNRYPAFEVYSRSSAHLPQAHSPEEVRGVSDVLHALHAATGIHVPTNEEWHYRPAGVMAPMPWRIVLKWRVSNPAGFEGGTKIHVNTIDPWTLRDRAVESLHELREAGRVSAGLRIGDERTSRDARLRYAE